MKPEDAMPQVHGSVDASIVYVHLLYISKSIEEIKATSALRDGEIDKLRTRLDTLDGNVSATQFWLKTVATLTAIATAITGWIGLGTKVGG